jgi:hypothetical protein
MGSVSPSPASRPPPPIDAADRQLASSAPESAEGETEMGQTFWRIDEGGLPGCPVGTVIGLSAEGST